MGTDQQETYNMTPQELKMLQKIQIELIAEVDRICKKCGIKYNMVGGTMLGAIRHQGYIPWDDDADIGFLREEYEKFREACKTELDNKYYMQDFRDTPGYRWGYGKLRKKGTLFLRLNQGHMPFEKGISIDLMPFDNVPDNGILRWIHFGLCFVFRKVFWSEAGRISEKNKYKRFLYVILSKIPERMIKKYFVYFIALCRKKKTKLVRILTFPTPKGKGLFGYKREWYDELLLYKFDRFSLPGAKDYDGYLRVKYGDYMKLPPESKRKVHPVSEISFGEDEELAHYEKI